MDRKRATALMEEMNIDAVVTTRYENTLYAGGVYVYTQRTLPDRKSAVILNRDGGGTYVFCSIEDTMMRGHSWISDLRGYTEFIDNPLEIVAKTLREKNLAGKTIAVERQYLAADDFDTLVRSGPNANYVDAFEFLKRLKMIKTADEITVMEKAAIATRKATEAAFAVARAGDTERKIATDIIYHLINSGADETAFITVATGTNGGRAHHVATDARLEPGHVVRTDLGGYFDGYCSDLGRTFVVGEPTKQQAEAYRKVRQIQESVIRGMSVGKPIKDLYAYCKESFEREGMKFTMPHIGHSIGTEMHERPMIQPRETEMLQEGMIFNVEPYYRGPDGYGYFVEDLVLITAAGPKLLSGRLAPSEIPVIA